MLSPVGRGGRAAAPWRQFSLKRVLFLGTLVSRSRLEVGGSTWVSPNRFYLLLERLVDLQSATNEL